MAMAYAEGDSDNRQIGVTVGPRRQKKTRWPRIAWQDMINSKERKKMSRYETVIGGKQK